MRHIFCQLCRCQYDALNLEYLSTVPTTQMTIALVNLVTQAFGFKNVNDRETEIMPEHLANAIPTLKIIQPQLVEAYKSRIQQCYDKGLNNHNDAAKLLRRVLKKHNRALAYRRTTVSKDNQRCSVYKYRLI